ncbi:MAG: hypothetical protein HYX46_00780 [Betaproteobacteria bacterium]|nr:hypothetical protein [Betaproteobacteria bacterium]
MWDENVQFCTEAGATRWDRAARIEAIAFALFLILAGVLLAIPGANWAQFALGLGVILLGKNLMRHLGGIKVRRIGLIVGGGALAAGLAGLILPALPILAVFLAVTGLSILGLALFKITMRGPQGRP